MYVQEGDKRILVVFDQRSLNDRHVSEESGRCVVGSSLSVLRKMFGRTRPSYAALYEAGTVPKKADREAASADYAKLLRDMDPVVIIVLPTPSKALAQDNLVQGTKVWRDLHPPDALDDMRGTFWERKPGQYVCPMFWPYPGAGQLNLFFMERWVQASLALAQGARLTGPAEALIHPSARMVEVLDMMARGPVAVDIETIPDTDKLTAIGVSREGYTVSVPFDGFQPACGSDYSPELLQWTHGKEVYQALCRCLASGHTKILHNGVFDLPILRSRGFVVNGPMHDTLAMHAISYPEARHGLQLAAATELIIPPWKSLFKPAGVKKDDARYWYWDAEKMRDYNSKDAYYTYALAESLAWKVGVKL